jgi:hypothetical protein
MEYEMGTIQRKDKKCKQTVRKPEGRDHLGDLGLYGRVVLALQSSSR